MMFYVARDVEVFMKDQNSENTHRRVSNVA